MSPSCLQDALSVGLARGDQRIQRGGAAALRRYSSRVAIDPGSRPFRWRVPTGL